MEGSDRERIRATLGRIELRRLVLSIRRRLETGRAPVGWMVLSNPTDAERAACDALMGRRPSWGSALRINLDALAEGLRAAGLAPDLRTAVEAVLGPIEDRVEVERLSREAWDSLWNEVRNAPELDRHASVGRWLETLRTTSVLRRMAGGDAAKAAILIRDLRALLSVLPVAAEPLASLAARLYGDAHALDAGTSLATLAVRMAGCIGGVEWVDNAEGRRSAWASVGVLNDELSTPVIVFRLPGNGSTPLGRHLQNACDAAEPVHVSLRMLIRYPLSARDGLTGLEVFACENPTVVAVAASRLGARCRPLVCVNGQFSTPALVLLRQLRQAGALVRYHGDFDPSGLLIAKRAMAESGGTAWRYGVEDYKAANPGVRFTGEPGPTPWSPELTVAMKASGRAVHEETVLEVLLGDLDSGVRCASVSS